MTIGVGSHVPDLSAEAYLPGTEYPARTTMTSGEALWTVLAFSPTDGELAAFAELDDAFVAEGARVVAADTTDWYAVRARLEERSVLGDVRFAVIADASRAVSGGFGVLRPDGSARRLTFVIDPSGVVRHVGRRPGEALHVVRILRGAAQGLAMAA